MGDDTACTTGTKRKPRSTLASGKTVVGVARWQMADAPEDAPFSGGLKTARERARGIRLRPYISFLSPRVALLLWF